MVAINGGGAIPRRDTGSPLITTISRVFKGIGPVCRIVLLTHVILIGTNQLGAVPVVSDSASAAVVTQHNDNGRTGAFLTEQLLAPSSVNGSSFGLLFQRQVTGQIYAQPLYVPAVSVGGSTRNLVVVATMSNDVYAFDADDPAAAEPIWHRQLGRPAATDFIKMSLATAGRNITKTIGITSTPVIDIANQLLYLVAKTCEGGDSNCRWPQNQFSYFLHALDLASGDSRLGGPVRVLASVPGATQHPGCGRKYPDSYGVTSLDAVMHLQRTGLLLSKGKLFFAFGAHQDKDPYHGWIVEYDAASLRQTAAVCITPDGCEGGVWQAGGGPAADDLGHVYVTSGNGTFSPDGRNLGSSVIKFNDPLEAADWFTPSTYDCLNRKDLDLGSAGPLLIPNSPYLVTGGKEGMLYLVDTTSMGHLQPSDPTRKGPPPCKGSPLPLGPPPVQSFLATKRCTQLPDLVAPFGCHHIHGSPVFWESDVSGPLVYVWPEGDYARGYKFDRATGRFDSSMTGEVKPAVMGKVQAGNDCGPTKTSKGILHLHCMPGGMLSISASGSTAHSGILWASLPLTGNALIADVPGRLLAFDAESLDKLWDSNTRPTEDGVGIFAKFSPPTIANGHVYLATFSGCLNVYGTLPSPSGPSVPRLCSAALPRTLKKATVRSAKEQVPKRGHASATKITHAS